MLLSREIAEARTCCISVALTEVAPTEAAGQPSCLFDATVYTLEHAHLFGRLVSARSRP